MLSRPFLNLYLDWSFFFLLCETKIKCMLCACLTIIFSGREGYSFTFCPSVSAFVCMSVWKEAEWFSYSCSICLWILFLWLFEPWLQHGWRLLKTFSESIIKYWMIQVVDSAGVFTQCMFLSFLEYERLSLPFLMSPYHETHFKTSISWCQRIYCQVLKIEMGAQTVTEQSRFSICQIYCEKC